MHVVLLYLSKLDIATYMLYLSKLDICYMFDF
jgi:hypothetical protein